MIPSSRRCHGGGHREDGHRGVIGKEAGLNDHGWAWLPEVTGQGDGGDIAASQFQSPSSARSSSAASTKLVSSGSARSATAACATWRAHSLAKPSARVSGIRICTGRRPCALRASRCFDAAIERTAVHGSQPELRVGTDADKLQRIGPALAVHEHEVGPQMAVAAVRIPTLHRMVDVTDGKRRVGDQEFESLEQRLVQVAAVRAPLHALEVAPELRRALDRPHAPASLPPRSSVVPV